MGLLRQDIRNSHNLANLAEQISALHPSGKVVVMPLDLGDLDSVSAFATAFRQQYDRLDLLIASGFGRQRLDVVRAVVADIAGVTDFSDDDEFVRDIGID